LRDKVFPVVDTVIKPEQVDLIITLTDGRKLHKYIEHAIGSLEVPMTIAQLKTKFIDLAEGILDARQIQELIDFCLRVEELPSVAAIAKAAVPVKL
jgi:2-methylcitrate dehydratase PrpD